MNLDDFTTDALSREKLRELTTQALAAEIVSALVCAVPNSEGKGQRHDWGDPYRKWTWQRWMWKIWYPVRRGGYQDCVRCGYTSRRLR